MNKLLLIDGSALMFRAYYATAFNGNLMKNSKGLHTNAIFGFANMMERVLKMDFTHVVVAFDKGKKNFRHDKYEAYKDGRSAMPEEMREQIPYMKKYVELLGIKVSEVSLYEADDIIGSFATKYYDDFDEIDILTGDKDLFQMINDKTNVLFIKKGVSELEKVDQAKFNEIYGLVPKQIIDLKALMGDSSDNIKGIPSVGEKTAIKLMQEYGSVENMIANMDSIKGKMGENIRANYELAIMCKDLCTIYTEMDLDFGPKDAKYAITNVDFQVLTNFYKDCEMHSFVKKMDAKMREVSLLKEEGMPLETEELASEETSKVEFKVINNEQDLKDILDKKSYMHLETFGDNYHNTQPLGFGIVNSKGNFFVPFEMLNSFSIDLQTFLTEGTFQKSVFDLKKLKVILKNHGLDIDGVKFDLLLAAYILNPKMTKDEFRVVASSLEYDDVAYDENVYGKGVKKAIPELEVYASHAVKKALAIQALEKNVSSKLMELNQFSLYEKVELPLASILGEMEYAGVKVDLDLLEKYKVEFDQKIKNVEAKIYELVGFEFNIASVKQLGEVLFEKLELPTGKKTKTGYSTNIEVLEALIGVHPVIEYIIEHRQITKLYSTYIIGLQEELHNGRAHTIYKQALTETGRLSSTNPNLQNIPIRTEEGRLIRKLFVPSDSNKVFVGADYSQVELRILAHISKTKSLIEAFKHGEDIHAKTAKDIFNVDEVNSDLRRKAKAINFGIIYGISANGLANDVGITHYEAKAFIEKYLDTYPGIKKYMDDTIEFAKENGFIETLYKRRRYIPELSSPVYNLREFGKRVAMNAPIQGTAADIIKIAMVKVDKALKESRLKAKVILQVHDELIFEVEKSDVDKLISVVKEAMENAVMLDVPLLVEVGSGASWYDLK